MKQNKYPQFYKRGSHNMVTEKVSITMREASEKEKKGGDHTLHGYLKGFKS
jgi:hypothetical protein